jgi:type IV pilus assembly protein PilA
MSIRRIPSAPKRAFTLVEIMIVVVIIALIIALAVPYFAKIRIRSQDNAVLNNIRQLASASSQYFLTNGVASVDIDQLVGPNRYIKSLTPIAGESYPLTFTQGATITVTGIGGARTITYAP